MLDSILTQDVCYLACIKCTLDLQCFQVVVGLSNVTSIVSREASILGGKTREIAHWLRALVANPDDLISIPETHMIVEGEN